MLPFSITMLVFALIAIWLADIGSIGAGAMLFAAGFVVLAGIAMLNVWRSHKDSVF